ncbi:hypothetical protein KOAAANKH_03078 [Brevundimonas sp. NIBR10]|uniref:hypothetical protein n=1 Tax=Brevundimonas sp. NIBR10 TaxID=3015997 RepID=UPI0022F1A47C|nr:hypothetical protein [Brevundimonas sp. NIBR10]WGM48182.1 hypothetical protein KOAAANKH_03078 [Brevundimonas sp. NIBR10]
MILIWLAATALMTAAPGASTQSSPAEAAAPSAAAQALAAFDPLIGKTWRGASLNAADTIDEVRFERILNGRAIRSTHSVNGGVYAGETLITWDPAQNRLVSFYATNGGFYTTGTIAVRGPGTFEFDQVAHGLPDLPGVRATTTFENGVYSIRSRHLIKGEWVDTGGFDYRVVE